MPERLRVVRSVPGPAAPVRSTYPRERVERKIEEAASYGIALILAPAGYGKTEAIRHTYDADSAIVIELDDRISTVEAFLKRVVEVVVPRHSRAFATMLERHGPDDAHGILVPWVATRLRSIEQAIVVDDLHRVFRDPRAPIVLQTLIESTRHSVTWVLSSRETPELPIGTWIANSWMHLPITSADLAFREDEAAGLAALLGLTIDGKDIAGLVDDTGGWPIALQLSLSTWDRMRARIPTGMRTRDVLFSYIDEQVWRAVEDENRALLEIAAILPQPSLAILGACGFPRAGNMLERLGRRISFIQRDENGEFHLHDVFREFINERHRLDLDRYADAVATVAHALAKLGLSLEALRLFTRLKDEENILGVLCEVGFELIESGEKPSVSAGLAALTGANRETSVACALRGYLQTLDGSFSSAEVEMRNALTLNADPRFYIAAARHLALFFVNRAKFPEATALIEDLLTRVPAESLEAIELRADLGLALGTCGDIDGAVENAAFAFERIALVPNERRPLVLNRVAGTYFYAQHFNEAEEIASESAALATSLGLDGLAARSYSLLYSIADAIYQDTTKTEFYARAMGVAANNAAERILRIASLERMYSVAAERGDDESVAAVEEDLRKLGHIRPFRDQIHARVSRVMVDGGAGKFRRAEITLETLDTKDLTMAENALRMALLALLQVANNDRDEAENALDKPFLVQVEPDLYSRRFVELARSYRALALWLLGRKTVARRYLTVDNSPLREKDRILIHTIHSICGTSRHTASDRLIHQLTEPLVGLGLGGFARFLRAVASVGFTPITLTRTESDLLRAWRAGDTINEIAERLGKSPHTIATQMKAIYRKTGTSGRDEALAFARERGLIS